MEEERRERHYTANVMVGNLLLEYFFSDRTFLEVCDGVNSSFTEEHSHASYELLICKRGSGFQFVDNCAHAYGDASVFLFAPFTRHAHISNAEQAEIRCSFRLQVAKEQPLEGSGQRAAASVIEHLKEQGYFSFTAGPALMGALEDLGQVLREPKAHNGLLVGGIMSALLSHVFQEISVSICQWSETAPADWASTGDLNYRKFLIDHFFDQLVNRNARIEDLCQQVHLSPSQLNRVIREIFGMTFKQKLIEVRIAYIKYFLKFSDMSINEIAQRTNFLENSNFSLFFKQHCGETPSQFRARERQSLETS